MLQAIRRLSKTHLAMLAVCLLALVLAGCSATGRVGPNGMYGNVSTTTDGRVNGTNDYYNGYSGMDGQTYNGTNGQTYNGTTGRTYNGTNGQTYSGTTGHIGTSGSTATQRGTGMAGGR